MSETATTVRVLTAEQAYASRSALADILIDCVQGGASVSFMTPLTREKAELFWTGVADGVISGGRRVLVAEDPESGDLLGTVQVLPVPHAPPWR